MATYKPFLTIDAIAIRSPTHTFPKNLQKFLPKYDPGDDVLPKYHIKQFMNALNLMNVEHEDVVCRLFLYTLEGNATKWFFNLAPGLSLLGKNLKRHLWHSLVKMKHQVYCP